MNDGNNNSGVFCYQYNNGNRMSNDNNNDYNFGKLPTPKPQVYQP